ncbi:DUF4129 domain-containing protein [Salegentibacter sp. F14]
MKILLPALGLFLHFPGKTYSQEHIIETTSQGAGDLQSLEFDEKLLEKWRSDKDFAYLDRETTISWWTQFKAWIGKIYHDLIEWLFGGYEPGSLLELLIVAFPYLLLLMVLFLIAWLFVKFNPNYAPAHSATQAKVFYSQEEKIIRSEDIRKLIRKAVSQENFRLAIRYHYLDTLRKMDRYGVIDYNFDKTNQDYSAELKSQKLQYQFNRITRIYEYSWYGDFQVSQEKYHLAESAFLDIEEMIKSQFYG